jgi:hypothetical protein
MMDFLYLGLMVAFFVVSIGIVKLVDRLLKNSS